MEVELKYAIAPTLSSEELREQLDALDLRPYLLHATGAAEHSDLLLDTPTRALTSGHHALRIRHYPDRYVMTFKGPNGGTNGAHEREEIEVELAQEPMPPYAALPQEIAARVLPRTQGEPLAPLFRNTVRRTTWDVLRDGQRLAEVALDVGQIFAGFRRLPLYELEVELKDDGQRADLDMLAYLLTQRLPLTLEPRSKLERGLTLLDDKRKQAAAEPLQLAGAAYIRKQVEAIRANEAAVREGALADAVHDMRVATRRLRAALRLLEETPAFPRKRTRKLRRRLRPLARALGEVRDADVLLTDLSAYADARPEAAGSLGALQERLAEQRRSAQTRLLRLLDASATTRTLAHLETAFRETEGGTEAETDGERALLRVRQAAGSLLWARYEDILRFEDRLLPPATPTPQDWHELRIACKYLRYAVELLAPALGKRGKRLEQTLRRAQDTLGNFHDTVAALERITALSHGTRSTSIAPEYTAELIARRDALAREAPQIWHELTGKRFRRTLAGALARL